MAENWRPPEWEGINPKPIGASMSSAFNREEMYKHGEKCADAMLGALKKGGYRFNQYTAMDCFAKFANPGEIGGWLVLIPEK